MKTNVLRNMALLILVIITGSCLDYTVTTVVNRNGSVYRQYEVRGDSSEVFNGSLKVPSGKEWKVIHGLTHKDKDDTTSEKSQYMYMASRTFKNAEELNNWMKDDTVAGRIKPLVNVEKHFRWFFTYFHYSETYPMTWPFKNIPVDSFMTDMEQSVAIDDGRAVYSPQAKTMVWKEDGIFALTPADSVSMKAISETCDEKMQRWMVASMAQSYIQLVDSVFGSEPVVKQLKGKSTQFTEVIMHKFEHLFDDSISAFTLTILADSLTGSEKLQELYRLQPAVFKVFDGLLEETGAIFSDDSYDHTLSLPGKVFATNARETTTKGLIWTMDSNYFLMKPYVLEASSRIANPWIMALTGLLAIALVVVLIRRRR